MKTKDLINLYKLHDCDLEKIDYDEKSHTLTMQVTLDGTIKNELKYNDSKIKIVFDNVKIISLDGDFNYLKKVEILNIKTKRPKKNGGKIYDFFFADYFAKQKDYALNDEEFYSLVFEGKLQEDQ